MKRLVTLITLASLTVFSATAHALSGDSTISEIENANLRCGNSGGGFAINATDGRVWQLDTKDGNEGIELRIIQFGRMRCPNCYDISAELILFGAVAAYRLQTSVPAGGSFAKPNLKVTFRTGDKERTIKMPCSMVH